MKPQDRENLLGVLEQKKEWLTKMREITKQCGIMLNNDEVDAFSKSLEAREGIIGRIDAFSRIEKQMKVADDAQIKVLKQQIRDIIFEIIQLDERNASLAQTKIELYKAQLKSLNQKKKGIGKYTKAYQKDEAYYFDKKK